MAAAATQIDEETMVRDAVGTVQPPVGVRLRRINPDYVDHTGDLAVQVIYAVSKRVPLTKRRVVELSRFRRTVEEAMAPLDLAKWTLVKFDETR